MPSHWLRYISLSLELWEIRRKGGSSYLDASDLSLVKRYSYYLLDSGFIVFNRILYVICLSC